VFERTLFRVKVGDILLIDKECVYLKESKPYALAAMLCILAVENPSIRRKLKSYKSTIKSERAKLQQGKKSPLFISPASIACASGA
jgi:hypothetical protein